MCRLFLTTLCLLLFASAPTLAGHSGIGLVKVVNGPVDAVRKNSAVRLTLGAPIYRGDIIRTSTFSSVGITFQDGSMLSLGPKAELSIDEFIFDPAANKLGFLTSLTLGVLTFTSGEIAKLRPEAVAVHTPVATIGVRGTRFLVSVETP